MSDASVLTSADLAKATFSPGPRSYYGLSSAAWTRIGILALLMIGLFWPNLRRLWLKTNPITGEANWGHAFFVPLIGLYYLYINREALLKPSNKRASRNARTIGLWLQSQVILFGLLAAVWGYYPAIIAGYKLLGVVVGILIWQGVFAAMFWMPSGRDSAATVDRLIDSSPIWFGLFCLLWGIWLYAWGIWPGQNDFFKDCAMVAILFGVVLMTCGWNVMKIAWFPIFFLVCAIPWPDLIYSRVALPLQQLAAWAAVKVLSITGVEAYREGTKLLVVKGLEVRILNVEEACAGLKSLMTFIAVGAAVGFLSSRATWQRIVITLSAIPIAVFCNMLRVAGVGIIDHYLTRKLSEGFAHQFVGMILLIPAFFLILLVGWILDNIFIEEVDKSAMAAPGSRSVFTEIPRTNTPKAPAPAPAANPPAVQRPAPTAAPITAAPITASPITQAPITKPAPAPVTKPQPAAKPQPAKPQAPITKAAPAPVTKPQPAATPQPAKPQAPSAKPAPASPADITAATMRLTSGSLRKPRPTPPPPQTNPQTNPPKPKGPEGK